MTYGNTGRLLSVDLTSGKIQVETPDEALYRDYLGGYGLAARLIMERQKPGVDPLGPDNTLVFTTGPLVGTPAITGCRFTVATKSPLTGTWGDSNCGGTFGPALKFAGFDGIIFTGKADSPVYLYIEDGRAELRPAEHLWGKDAVETEEELQREHGDDTEVACIGQAGEKLSLISGIMNDKGRAAGRSGVGAVMGSKKLKAIAVRGSRKPQLHDPDRMRELVRKYTKEMARPAVDHFRKYGTIDHVAASAFSNDSPIKNWAGVGVRDFPQAEKISGDSLLAYQSKNYGCWHCIISCGGLYRVEEGPFKTDEAHKPEYETCGMFGNNLLVDNPEALIKINDLCNRYGLDTISAGSAVGFAIELFEEGIIGEKDTGGLALRWGDAETVVRLTEMIGKREGFGDLLADGTRKAAERIGRDVSERAIHVQGQDLPAHDPRYAKSWALYYLVDATPARHTQIGLVSYDRGGKLRGLEGIPPVEEYGDSGRGALAAKVQDLFHAFYSCGVCMFAIQRMDVNAWGEFLEAATGQKADLEDMERIGKRIATIRQMFNVREGVDVARFSVPGRAYGHPPLDGGPLEGISLDMEGTKKDYWEYQGWDRETGVPKEETLKELGITGF